MAQVPLAFLIAPEEQYLSIAGLANFLRLKPKEVRQLLKDKILPRGKQRAGRTGLRWTQCEAAVCKWIMDNRERFREEENL